MQLNFLSVSRRSGLILLVALLTLSGCGGGSSDSISGTAGLSGKITFDSVPAVASSPDLDGDRTARLDYSQIKQLPARGVLVEAIADSGVAIASTQTDANGNYLLSLPVNTRVRIRASARMLQKAGSGASWDFSVRDNTSSGYLIPGSAAALYAIEGAQFVTDTTNPARDLHAASSWNGSAYTAGGRAAAPFAILDMEYAAKQKVLAADSEAVFAPMVTYWSPSNRPASGEVSRGFIETSYWDPAGDRPGLYILGAENVDTDEYDSGVIVHEWGHYFESTFSRSDSRGGSHSPGDSLDMNLAFGEAWGNALSAMVREDAVYVDTNGPQQSLPGIVLDLNTIPADEPKAWFNESSVQHVLYQLYKSPAIGFSPIYRVMTGPQKTTAAFTSLFSFATYLRAAVSPAGKNDLDNQLMGINTVHGDALDIWGALQQLPPLIGAIRPDPSSFVLPVYTVMTPGQPATTVCRTGYFDDNDDGSNNKLGSLRYLRLKIAIDGAYQLQIDSPENEALEFEFFRSGSAVDGEEVSAGIATRTTNFNLLAGDYVALISDATNPNACFTLTLSQ